MKGRREINLQSSLAAVGTAAAAAAGRVRAPLSRGLLSQLERHTPGPVQCIALQILADTTAKGFGVRSVRLPLRDSQAALREYADFTKRCMAEAGKDSATDDTARQLYRAAYALGTRVRRASGLTDPADLQRLVFLLYRFIGIDMGGALPGEITVHACYFSRMYTPAECAVMSSVDSGVIAGICGGGELFFTQRITAGCGCCKACFVQGGSR